MSDAEAILGIGDQVCHFKGKADRRVPEASGSRLLKRSFIRWQLELSESCTLGGIMLTDSPSKALAVTLDVGTNNKDLLDDDLYLVCQPS